MPLGRAHRITGWTGLLSRKTLALVGVLVLGAFVFTGREARAQQFPQEEAQQQSVAEVVLSQHTVVIDGEVVEPVAGTPPIEESPPGETLPARFPAGAVWDPVVRYDLVVTPKPTPPVPEPEPPVLEPDPLVDTNLAPEPVPVEPGVDLEPNPVLPVQPAPPVDLAPEPPILNEPAPASVAPAVPVLEEEEYWTPSDLETTVSSAVEALQGAADVLGDVTDGSLLRLTAEDEGLIYTALGALSSGGEADITPERTESSGSPSGGPEGPSRSAPQPSSPFALPPVGSGALPLPGGDVGSGGVHLLLLCVLVYGLVLLRRDGGLSWGFWEPPKLSSALLLPLERPG